MLEILFLDIETGRVNYGVTDVAVVRYITPSEIGFTYVGGRNSSCAFTYAERVEVKHKTSSPIRREALMREVTR